jgi:DNA transposition AAA+ family ATPase
MNKIFVKTQNVKNFIGLVENLQNKPKNIPKMGLVYGEPGLGKSQTALWLACKYDGIYLRASNLMTGRWLLEELVKELDEIPRYLTSDNFNLVVKKLKAEPKIIFIDEIDYLMNNYKTIETLRDIHDETDCPIIFIGMGLAHRKLERYKHLYDRFGIFGVNDLKQIFDQLSEIKVDTNSIEYIYPKIICSVSKSSIIKKC